MRISKIMITTHRKNTFSQHQSIIFRFDFQCKQSQIFLQKYDNRCQNYSFGYFKNLSRQSHSHFWLNVHTKSEGMHGYKFQALILQYKVYLFSLPSFLLDSCEFDFFVDFFSSAVWDVKLFTCVFLRQDERLQSLQNFQENQESEA